MLKNQDNFILFCDFMADGMAAIRTILKPGLTGRTSILDGDDRALHAAPLGVDGVTRRGDMAIISRIQKGIIRRSGPALYLDILIRDGRDHEQIARIINDSMGAYKNSGDKLTVLASGLINYCIITRNEDSLLIHNSVQALDTFTGYFETDRLGVYTREIKIKELSLGSNDVLMREAVDFGTTVVELYTTFNYRDETLEGRLMLLLSEIGGAVEKGVNAGILKRELAPMKRKILEE